MFTASTEHDSKIVDTITYTCFNRIIELNENLNGLVMEESVYSGCDTKFKQCLDSSPLCQAPGGKAICTVI